MSKDCTSATGQMQSNGKIMRTGIMQWEICIMHRSTINCGQNTFADSFLQGQNHYTLFAEIADKITAKNVTIYDSSIGGMFSAAAVDYAMGKTATIEDAYRQFRTNVSYGYGDIDVGLS